MPFNGVTNYGLVSRKGAGRRSLEFGGRVPENEAWSLEEGCRKAMLGVSRKGAGKRGLGSGGRVPESEAWSVMQSLQFCMATIFPSLFTNSLLALQTKADLLEAI